MSEGEAFPTAMNISPERWAALTLDERMSALTGDPLPEPEIPIIAEGDGRRILKNRQLLGTTPLSLAARLAMGVPLPATLSTHRTEDVVDL